MIFLAVVLICTFVSKSIYNASLPKVAVKNADRANITYTTNVIGLVEFDEIDEIESKGTWKIVEVLCHPGDNVKLGTPLLRVDMDNYEIQLLQLTRQLMSLDRQMASLTKNTVLSAPFSGILCDVTALKVGDQVAKGEAVCRIQDRSTLLLDLYFGVEYQEFLLVGATLNVTLPDSSEIISGQIVSVAGETSWIDEKETVKVRLSIPNSGTLVAGTTATACLKADKEEIAPIDPGVLVYCRDEVVTAPSTETVVALDIGEEQAVTQGDILLLGDKNGVDLFYERKIVSLQIEMLKSEMPQDGYIKAQSEGKIDVVSAKVGKTYSSAETLVTVIPKGSHPIVVWYLPLDVAKNYDTSSTIAFTYVENGTRAERDVKIGVSSKSWDKDKQEYKFTANYTVADISLNGLSLPLEVTRQTDFYKYTVPVSAIYGTDVDPCIYIIEERDGLFGMENRVRAIPVEVLEKNDKTAAIESIWLVDTSKIIVESSNPISKGDVVFVIEDLSGDIY